MHTNAMMRGALAHRRMPISHIFADTNKWMEQQSNKNAMHMGSGCIRHDHVYHRLPIASDRLVRWLQYAYYA